MKILRSHNCFYQWFCQAFLFDSEQMLGSWVSQDEINRVARTMAPHDYPCLAMMLPGSPHTDTPSPVYFYREQVASWLAQLDGACGAEGDKEIPVQ